MQVMGGELQKLSWSKAIQGWKSQIRFGYTRLGFRV